jgi:microcystin-dependent protein
LAALRRLIKETTELRRQLNLRVAPVGTIVAFGGNTVPAGWRLCDGALINRLQQKEYEPLFRAIGYAWGESDNMFKLPDPRGRFLRGIDGNAHVDVDTGRTVGSSQVWATAMPHTAFSISNNGGRAHGLNQETTAGRSDGKVSNTIAFPFTGPRRMSTDGMGDHNHGISGGDPETRPVNRAVVQMGFCRRWPDASRTSSPRRAIPEQHPTQ